MNPLADALRKRLEAERLRGRGLQFQNVADSAGAPTVGGGMVQGMRGAQATPEAINWGGIIQSGIGNYQAAKDTATASKMDKEADELSQAFMESTFKNDPESYRLYQMAQVGVPGAEQALAERVNPKKEAMGAFLQHIQSGVADPDMVGEVAERYGVDPVLARKAVETQQKRAAERDAAARQQELADYEAKKLIDARYRPAPASSARGGDVSFQEYMAMSPEERAAYDKFKGRKSAEEGERPTAGRMQVRDKKLLELDEDVQNFQAQSAKFENLRPMMNDPDLFGPKQKLAGIMAESSNGIISTIGTAMRSEAAVLLEDYLNDEVLRRMSMLGGNDSNEELNRMRASLPKVSNDPAAARALMDQLHEWQVDTLEATRRRRADMQSFEYFDKDFKERDYFKEVRAESRAPQNGGNEATKPRIKILSIE